MIKTIILCISIMAFAAVLLPGQLYKFSLLELGSAFTLFRSAVYIGIASLVLVLIQWVFLRKTVSKYYVSASVLFACVAIAIPVIMMNQAKQVPPIHDITSDINNPPKFDKIAELRANAPNPLGYEGGEVSKQQLEAYPQIITQYFNHDVKTVMQESEKALDELGLELVSVDYDKQIIEAYEQTFWFGFIDDVILRFDVQDGKTTLDIRSKSRVGRSDLGVNAKRIERIFAKLESLK